MSRLEWILGLVLLALLIVVVGLAASLWLTPNRQVDQQAADELALAAVYANQVAPTRAAVGQTAKNAYLLAYQATQSWQDDARLINATATWPQGARAANLAAGQEMWGFVFYSPSAQTTAVVSVADGMASLSPRDGRQQLQLLEVTGWQMDSSDAIEAFLENGGHAFLEREGITVFSMTLALNDPKQSGRAEWLMSLLATGNGRSFTMRIDATSGDVLEVIDAS